MEAAGNVLDLVVPGAGKVIPALQLAYELCSSLHECGEVCALVQRRFQELLDAILDLDGRDEVPRSSVLPRFRDALGSFIAFLQRHQKKNVLMRMASNRYVMDQVNRTNEEIDALFRLLQLEHMGEQSDWRRAVDQCWTRQQSEMQELLQSHRAIAQLLLDSGLKEALALLKYESQYQRDKNTPQHLQMMETTFQRAVVTAKIQVPDIPRWFIPSDDVSYTVEDFGDGYLGRVNRGQWNHTDVVIKTLLVSDEKTQSSFLNEANTWIKLNHPHILKLYGACHVSSPPFFVCEDAEQGNFRQFFSHGQNRHVFWRLFREAVNGMLYLEREKIVHGNLKCNNLLIDAGVKAKIADFGFSFIRSESRALSKKSQVDSVRWKAPECIRGDMESPNLCSDVYSLGMCIIEAWTGDVPWGSDCGEDEIREFAYEFRMPLQPVDMSDRAWQLLERMCHSHPVRRISLSEAADVMAAIAEAESQEVHQTTPCPSCDASMALGARSCSSCRWSISATGLQYFSPPPSSRSPLMLKFKAKLESLSPLCDNTQEYQLLCHHVRSRLQDIYRQLSIQDRHRNIPDTDILLGCFDIADRFHEFLESLCAKTDIVVLVLSHREVLTSLEQFHHSTDSIVELLSTVEVETWKQQWTRNCSILGSSMQHRVASVSDLSMLIPGRAQQSEAMEMLRAQIENRANQDSPDHLALLLELLDKIQRLVATSPGLFKLTITLVRASDLVVADYWKNSSDPYVVFMLGNVKFKSTMIPRILDPVWYPNESFQFTVDTRAPTSQSLAIEVWDDDTLEPDDLIGTLRLPVQSLIGKMPSPDAAVAYSLQVPSRYAKQNRESKIYLKITCQRV